MQTADFVSFQTHHAGAADAWDGSWVVARFGSAKKLYPASKLHAFT